MAPVDSRSRRPTDEAWMRRCLELALKGQGRVSPNPMVGAVVLDRRGRLVGEGFHRKAGAAHGEVAALRVAKGKAVGGDTLCQSRAVQSSRADRTVQRCGR